MRSLPAKTDVADLVDVEGGDCRVNVDPPKVERIVENLIAKRGGARAERFADPVRCWREATPP